MTYIPPYIAEHLPRPAKTGEGADEHGTWTCPLSEWTSYARDPETNEIRADLPDVVHPGVPHDAHKFGEGMYMYCPGIPGTLPMTPLVVHEERLASVEKYLARDQAIIEETLRRIHHAEDERRRLTALIEVTRVLESQD